MALALPAWAADVLIVSSERTSGYLDAAQAAQSELNRVVGTRLEVAQVVAFDSRYAEPATWQGVRVVITLGTDALSKTLSRDLKVPIVAALIPRAGYERVMRELGRKPPAAVTPLYLDQPFSRQMDLLRLMMPDARKVGVLWGAESLGLQPVLTAAAQSRGLELVSENTSNAATLSSGLKAVLEEADVLLAVADPQVYNGGTISNILLATYRARVPVMAFSPAYVRAGALISLHSTPQQIGVQAAQITRSYLQGATSLAAQYPSEFAVSVNDHVARSLGMVLDANVLDERLHRMERRP